MVSRFTNDKRLHPVVQVCLAKSALQAHADGLHRQYTLFLFCSIYGAADLLVPPVDGTHPCAFPKVLDEASPAEPPTSASMIEIKHQESQHRYGAFVDGQHAGFCQYELAGNTVTFTHTVVRPEFEGQGIGSSLAVFALEDCRARRQQVVPECSFLRQYIDRHGEFHDLLASSGDST